MVDSDHLKRAWKLMSKVWTVCSVWYSSTLITCNHFNHFRYSVDDNEWFPWSPNVLQVLNYSLIHESVPLCIASVSWAVSHGCSVFGCWRLERLHPNMPYKLTPELTMNRRWTVQYCLRVPPSGTLIVPIGNPRVLCRNKAFFCVSFNHCFVVWINFDLFFSYSS